MGWVSVDLNLTSRVLFRVLWFPPSSKLDSCRESVRADLQGTIFVSCDKLTTGLGHDLRLVCTSEKCRSTLKHVLKRYGNRKSCRRPAVSLSHATKIVTCKSALRRPISIAVCRTEIFIPLKLPYFCEKKKKKESFQLHYEKPRL